MKSANLLWLRTTVWFGAELLLPVFVILVLWPVTQHFLGLTNAYERTFSGADFLPVAGVLLISSGVDGIFSEIPRQKKSMLLMLLSVGAVLIALFVLACYGFLKLEYMQYNFPRDGAVVKSIQLCADISIASIVLAGLLSLLVKAENLHQEYSNEG